MITALSSLVLFATATPVAAPAFPNLIVQEPAPINQGERDVLLRAARNSLALGQLDVAVSRFEELLSRFPDDHQSRAEYAGLMVQANKLEKAIKEMQVVVMADPANLEHRRFMADVLIQARRFSEAEGHLIAVLDGRADDIESALMLARVHAWQKEYEAATEVYRRYLRGLNSTDEATKRLIAPLLLDTQHPEEALSMLQDLYSSNPDDIVVLSDLIRCQTQLANHRRANELVTGMATVAPKATGVRLSLSEYLANVGNYRAAIRVYDQIARAEPNNDSARIGQAELYLAAMMPEKAQMILDDRTIDNSNLSYKIARAELHMQIGEYAEAKSMYQELLDENRNNDDARLAYGDLLFVAQEYERARSELTKIGPASHLYREARVRIASCLAAERRFDESNASCRQLVGEDPGDVRPLTQLIRNLGNAGEIQQAEWVANDYFKRNKADGYGVLEVRLALANSLMLDDQALRARQLYLQVLDHPAGRVPEAHYGLAASYDALDDNAAAQEALLASTLTILGDDIRSGIMIADHAFHDGRHKIAIDMYQKVLRWDPSNIIAQVRLAEAQAASWDVQGQEEAARTFGDVLRRSQSNIRARLGLARSFAAQKNVDSALEQYDIILRYDARNSHALRERARVLFWDQELDASSQAYTDILSVPGFENMETNLHEDVEPLDFDHLQAERRANAEVRANAELEYNAKSLRQNLNLYAAIPVYRDLVNREPLNQEARFELAQCLSETGQSRAALAEYEELLKVNPNHREAAQCIQRNHSDMQPRAELGLRMVQQEGIDGLGRLDRTDTMIGGKMPLAEEDDWFSLNYMQSNLVSEDFNSTGNVLSLGGQFTPMDQSGAWEKLILHGNIGFEDYIQDLDADMVYDLGFRVRFNDRFQIFGKTFTQNVIENHNSIKPEGDPSLGGLINDQGPVSRSGSNIGIGAQVNRKWDVSFNLTTANYSDDNSLVGWHLYNGYSITLPPNELKVSLNVDAQDFSIPVADNYKFNVGDARYFAPNDYTTMAGSLEWKQWLSRDHFKGAKQTWYNASFTGIWDSDGDFYNQIRAGLHYDYSHNIAIEVHTGLLTSAFYNTAEAAGYLVIAF